MTRSLWKFGNRRLLEKKYRKAWEALEEWMHFIWDTRFTCFLMEKEEEDGWNLVRLFGVGY